MLPQFCNSSITDNILLHKRNTVSLNNVKTWYIYCLLNSSRYDIPVCQLYKYIVTCISMVITCQALEFGTAITVLGYNHDVQLLTGRTVCWWWFIKHRDSRPGHNRKWVKIINNAKNKYYNTQTSDIHLAQSLWHIKRHNVYKELETIKCEICFPQTYTSWSLTDRLLKRLQYITAISSKYTTMHPISTPKKWVINTYVPIKNVSTWGKKWEVLTSIHKPRCLSYQDTQNTCIFVTYEIFVLVIKTN
jgi:hypothetical protein